MKLDQLIDFYSFKRFNYLDNKFETLNFLCDVIEFENLSFLAKYKISKKFFFKLFTDLIIENNKNLNIFFSNFLLNLIFDYQCWVTDQITLKILNEQFFMACESFKDINRNYSDFIFHINKISNFEIQSINLQNKKVFKKHSKIIIKLILILINTIDFSNFNKYYKEIFYENLFSIFSKNSLIHNTTFKILINLIYQNKFDFISFLINSEFSKSYNLFSMFLNFLDQKNNLKFTKFGLILLAMSREYFLEEISYETNEMINNFLKSKNEKNIFIYLFIF